MAQNALNPTLYKLRVALMGLLSDGSIDENLAALRLIVGDVLEHWDKCFLPDEGLELEVGQRSLSRICLIGDRIFDGEAFPQQPGPFKRAAAVCALIRMFADLSWMPLQKRDCLTVVEEMNWRARFALTTVPVTLFRMEVELDGETVHLSKPWEPATLHLQIEILAWLRWLERPAISETAVDLSRLQRTIMALAMIIEQSYYLVDAVVDCNVMNRADNCLLPIKEDDLLWQDLTLFYPVPLESR